MYKEASRADSQWHHSVISHQVATLTVYTPEGASLVDVVAGNASYARTCRIWDICLPPPNTCFPRKPPSWVSAQCPPHLTSPDTNLILNPNPAAQLRGGQLPRAQLAGNAKQPRLKYFMTIGGGYYLNSECYLNTIFMRSRVNYLLFKQQARKTTCSNTVYGSTERVSTDKVCSTTQK